MFSIVEIIFVLAAVGGGTGTLAVIARNIILKMLIGFAGICLVLFFLWHILTGMERSQYVTWHYNGTEKFSELPTTGNISITFTNNYDKTVKISNVRLVIESRKVNDKGIEERKIAYQSEHISTRRDDMIGPTDFILGAHQTVTMVLPYEFSFTIDRKVDGEEIDHIDLSSLDGSDPVQGEGNGISLLDDSE